jgi:hypothetical protein
MRSDIVPGAIFPDYELSDHTAKRRKLSEIHGQHPMGLVLSRGSFCPRNRRQRTGISQRPTQNGMAAGSQGPLLSLR